MQEYHNRRKSERNSRLKWRDLYCFSMDHKPSTSPVSQCYFIICYHWVFCDSGLITLSWSLNPDSYGLTTFTYIKFAALTFWIFFSRAIFYHCRYGGEELLVCFHSQTRELASSNAFRYAIEVRKGIFNVAECFFVLTFYYHGRKSWDSVSLGPLFQMIGICET